MNAAREPFELRGKRVVVTGGLTGIGQAIAVDCALAGAEVIVASRDRAKGAREASRMQGEGLAIEYRFLDVADDESCAEFFAGLAEGLDVLVNNSGITSWDETLSPEGADAWRRVMSVNLDGVWRCSVGVAPIMRERGCGAIVNVGSMSGLIVNRPQWQTAYNTSKAAVHHLTRSLAAEWSRYGIRVNAVAPGYVATDLLDQALEDPEIRRYWVEDTVMERTGTPQEIAHAVRFLAADASSYITGAVLPVDGGYTLW
ncbi:SDR family NAD(P)-dependent oxidoreductase [Leucobacter celer]|uniref:SDR family NAD(P)-dependent oxidoreductase n=1 Tax=Leucobacter celer TaxID=668625 RepID=UPI0006A75D46|nr:glucose 1-dehydrogenase [Leucobacter celer]